MWVGSFKVRAFPWIDGKRIYVNVQHYEYGQSITKPPIWEKTVYITDDEAGRSLVYDFTHTLVEGITNMQIPDNTEVVLTVQQ